MTAVFSASGGTKTIDGFYTVHRFTASGSLVCTGSLGPDDVEVLVVGGGGGGSQGGGGAGGYLTGAETLTGSMAVVVGGGGAGASVSVANGANGGDSSFGTRTAAGGGGGGGGIGARTGSDGGSGGGAGFNTSPTVGGAAVPSGQGYAGGDNAGYVATPYPAGGGGGAGALGGDATANNAAGPGGAGLNNDIVLAGTNVGYAGGGGGGLYADGTPGSATHGGGAGNDNAGNGTAGTANTGGGGGGAGQGRTGGDGGSGIVVVRYLTQHLFPASVWNPPAKSTPSLLIGSDALGWQEFGSAATLGTMTRGMPGGDGSLGFTIPHDEVAEHRNQLVDGAEVHLTDGATTWDGMLVGDPTGARYRTVGAVPVAASGMWSHAARRRDVCWVWVDSDPTQWFRIRQRYNAADDDPWVEFVDQGKFTTDTEGRLYLRGDADRTFTGYARAALAYWLNQGLVNLGNEIYGVSLIYKSNYPTDWRMTVRSKDATPWVTAHAGTLEESDTTSRPAWRTDAIALTQGSQAVIISLNFNQATAGSPATDPWIKVKSIRVLCRGSVGAPDTSVTLDEAMCDLATLAGLATVTRSETVGAAQAHLALRPDTERSVADGLRELAAMHSGFIEQQFDYTGTAWRYTVNAVPAAVNPARNHHWILRDEVAGESSAGVVRDYESAPAYVRALYLASGVAGVPDGSPRSYCYPSEPTSATDNVLVYPGLAAATLTDAQAAALTERVWTQLAQANFTGPAVFGATAQTTAGQDLPSSLMRPGDRVSIPGRAGADGLYVSDTSYNFGTQALTAGLGWPFDLVPGVLRSRGRSGAHPGIAGPKVVQRVVQRRYRSRT